MAEELQQPLGRARRATVAVRNHSNYSTTAWRGAGGGLD